MKWALLLVSSVAAADPLPVSAMIGGGWRSASATPSLPSGTPGDYGPIRLGNEQDLGTLEGSLFARVSPAIAIGVHVTTSSTVSANGANYGNESGTSVAMLMRPVTIAVALQYQYKPSWIIPWVGRELLHTRYAFGMYDTHSGMTRNVSEWDDNGAVVGLAAGIDLVGNEYLKVAIFAEVETLIPSGTATLDDSAFTFGFALRY